LYICTQIVLIMAQVKIKMRITPDALTINELCKLTRRKSPFIGKHIALGNLDYGYVLKTDAGDIGYKVIVKNEKLNAFIEKCKMNDIKNK